jgi:uncharacterized RmlC-like cupin family protein
MANSATERVRVITPGRTYVGKQGFTYGAGASAETVGAQRICMNILPMPNGARAKVHYHRGIETIAYLLDGDCAVYYGDKLEHRVSVRARDQVYIPADVPHAPCNESGAPPGLSCIPPAAIRMALYFCPTSMRFLQHDSGHPEPTCHDRSR